jgi:hypothetical protein
MSKLTILGSGFFLLLCAGIYVAIHFPIGCLFMPCDRSVRFVLQPPQQALDGCDLLLFAPRDKTLSAPLHRLAIKDDEAEEIFQPSWNESSLVVLSCKGLRPSDPQLVDYRHKSEVYLHIQKPGA